MSRSLNRRDLIAAGLAAGALAPATAFAQVEGSASPVLRTAHGPVRGYVEDGIKVFRGVRYGADTRPRRFMAALPPEPWTEIREAAAFGPIAPQKSQAGGSEDCLFLNVWTPGLADGGKRPILFWIHGGAYSNGSATGATTDGVRLAKRGDVVVISIHHRLNVFGYGYFARLGDPGFADSGNVGQLDLVLALKWVKANAAAFGGDPDRVLVFGQSGGGAKIATMLGQPSAQSLYSRAITMSGQQVTASGPLNATRRAKAFMAQLGLKPDQMAELRALSTERIVEGLAAEDPILGYGGLYFGPVLDDRHLLRHPFYPDANPIGRSVPTIIGNCHDETKAFLGGDPKNFNLTWDELPGRMDIAALRIDVAPETVVAAYRKMYPTYSPSDVLFAATTAGRSWRGAVIEAEEKARSGAPAWAYEFAWASPLRFGGKGAGHGSDIAPAFDNIAKLGDRPVGEKAQAVADMMSETFIAFARTGDPNNRHIPPWETYGLPRRQTMVFDVTPRMVDDPRGQERTFFSRIPYIQPGT
jgi:para-nitrobenzyl esterase